VHASSVGVRHLVRPVAGVGALGLPNVFAIASANIAEGEIVADGDPHSRRLTAAVIGSAPNGLGTLPDKLRKVAISLEVTSRVTSTIVWCIAGHFTIVPALGNSSGDICNRRTGSHVLPSRIMNEGPCTLRDEVVGLLSRSIVPSQRFSGVISTVYVVVEENHVLVVLARGEIRLLISHDVGRSNASRRNRADGSRAGFDGGG